VLTQVQALICLNVILIALRFVTAAHLPLSFDESYFWLWSKHLALSYYDHPPLIALTIRAGTLAFGDTELGVRAVSLLCSIAASFAVWRAGAVLGQQEEPGATACTLFNLTLMTNSQFIAATPDALVMAAASFLILSLARLQQTGERRWWLAIAGAVGLALLSKYTALFLATGVGLWCVASREGRRWMRTPSPYSAAMLASLCFLPALLWNYENNWVSFRFQFGRVTTGGLTYRYLLELVLAQLALASPFILAAALGGLYRASRLWRESLPVLTVAAVVWPALIYFLFHALHDRVQGNWPSFIYPALALLAAWEITQPPLALSRLGRICRRWAIPSALVLLAAVYLQSWTGAIAVGKQDPLGRMMAFGVKGAAQRIGELAARQHAAAILTSKYVVTGWLAFYLAHPIPIVQIADQERWLEAPKAETALLRRPLLYVTQNPARELPLLRARFSTVRFIQEVGRQRGAATLDNFYVYSLSGLHGPAAGRLVYGAGS
jgi:4-amino-4-deoxy-L-arabinose transferase-like glycosyltransferase